MRVAERRRAGARWRARFGDTELSSFTARDTRALYRVRNDPWVRRHMSDPRPLSVRRHRAWVRANLLCRHALELYMVRHAGRVAGFGLLRNFNGRTAEFGLMLREPDRHGRIAVACAVRIVDRAFRDLGLSRLTGYIVRGNARSLRFGCGLGARVVNSDRRGHVKVEFTPAAFYAAPAVARTLARDRARPAR